jgi:serine/threonine protein kinase
MLPKATREDFTFVSKAGGGGQAVVETWRFNKTGDTYAIKIYHAPSADMSERISNEARMLMSFKFPSIVMGYGLFMPTESDRSAWIVMENMSGGSLSDAIQRKLLDATKMNCVIISLVKAVVYLHSKGILHRDIKPSNVLFDRDGIAKLSDLGSARAIEGDITQTKGGKTPFYAAPERHGNGVPSGASDMRALGLTMFEAIAGTPPSTRSSVSCRASRR